MIVTDGLVLYLHGACGKNNPATRVWKDLSGNGNDGKLVNFGYTEDSGWGDGGLRFDGVDDAIKSSPIVLDKSFTLSVVFKYNSKEVESSVIFNLPYAKSYGWNIALGFSQRHSDDLAQAVLIYKREDGSITRYISPDITLVDGEKYTLSARFDYNTKTIDFIKDNQIVSSDTLTEFSEHVENRGIGVGWGSNGPAERQHILYDIKLYNRALTDEEILQNYQAGHQWIPQIGKREATTTMKPITTSLSRKGTGRRELITTVKSITTSLERKGKGTREVISTIKPIAASLSRKGVGRREVITTMQPITSSISKKLPPIHANITAKERTPNITTRERIPKLEVD